MNDTKSKVYPEWHPMHDRMQQMSLRDYFAAQVLQGLLASGLDQPKFEFARKSYEMADAMLKARNQ